MQDWKQKIRTVLVVGLTLCAVGVLLPSSEAGHGTEPQVETWVETAAAIQKTLDGDCDNQLGTSCHEQCVSFNGGPPMPTNYFQCR